MKKLLTVCMILSINAVTYAQASVGPSQAAPTAEETLLARVYQIAGSNESTEQGRTELQSALQDYENTSPADGREQRITDALIAMQVFSPQQAQILTDQITASSAAIANQNFSSKEQQDHAIQMQISQIVSQMPQGAQFSRCNDALTGLGVFLIGGGFIYSLGALADNNLDHPRLLGVGLGMVVVGVVTSIVSTSKCSE